MGRRPRARVDGSPTPPATRNFVRVRTVFFEAVMFLLHCYPHIVLLPRVSFPSSPLSS